MYEYDEANDRYTYREGWWEVIEDSFPTTLSEFIDAILPPNAYYEGARWNAQKRALEFAKDNYNLEPFL